VTRLFDSTVLIAHLRGDVRATDLLLRSVAEGALASVVSRAEVEGGMRAYERDVAQLFDALDLLPVTDAIARRAGPCCAATGAGAPRWTSRTTSSPRPRRSTAPSWSPWTGPLPDGPVPAPPVGLRRCPPGAGRRVP